MKQLTIVLTGGGSGGHLTPLLSLARALKVASPRCQIVYIGLKGGLLEAHLRQRYKIFDEVCFVSSGKFRRYHGQSLLAHLVDLKSLLLNSRDFFRVISGILAANRVLKRSRADLVFCKGGYVSVPVGIAAKLRKIPIITHDSDTVPGLANRIVGRFARLHATGMPAQYYNYPTEKMRYVGIPVDERIQAVGTKAQQEFKRQLGLPTDSLLLLVGGAGLGARDINNKVLSLAPELLRQVNNLHIIHLSGIVHQQEVENQYKIALGHEAKRVTVLGFTSDFYKYSGAADIVITRAGATTIAELAIQKKAVIIIPAPHLTGGHQLKNADELRKNHAALIVDNGATPSELLEAISTLIKDREKRRELANNLGQLAKPNAATDLAMILLKAAEGPHIPN